MRKGMEQESYQVGPWVKFIAPRWAFWGVVLVPADEAINTEGV